MTKKEELYKMSDSDREKLSKLSDTELAKRIRAGLTAYKKDNKSSEDYYDKK